MKQFDTGRLLTVVFDRLYVLRNQLVHGGATWNSSVNRSQVKDGAAVLGWMLPLFIDIMMDNPDGLGESVLPRRQGGLVLVNSSKARDAMRCGDDRTV